MPRPRGPRDEDQVKSRHNVTVTPTSWEGVEKLVQKLGIKSVSSLIEAIGRHPSAADILAQLLEKPQPEFTGELITGFFQALRDAGIPKPQRQEIVRIAASLGVSAGKLRQRIEEIYREERKNGSRDPERC